MPKAKKIPQSDRKVLYPEDKIQKCVGDKALTATDAKRLLGWEEVQDENYLFRDYEGHKIRCTNNLHNRPFDRKTADAIAQSILNRWWKFNRETVIIGKTGTIISAQHRLVGLVFAAQRWASEEQKEHWQSIWKTEPTIDTYIAFGCDEDYSVVQTIDNVRTRSTADILYCSPDAFPKEKDKARKSLCSITAIASKFVWDRSAQESDKFIFRLSPLQHADFVFRHRKIMPACMHIYQENSADRKISNFIMPASYAAGLTYLMGVSASDDAKYRSANMLTEKKLDFSRWDKAEEFWVLLNSGSTVTNEVQHAIASKTHPDTGEGVATLDERLAIVCKAWNLFVNELPIKKGSLDLQYDTNDEGISKLVESVHVGGIDISEIEKTEVEAAEDGEPESDPDDTEKADIESRLKQVNEAKKNGMLDKPKAGPKPRPKPAPVAAVS